MDELQRCEATGPEISAADLYDALRLRSEVFVIEQTCVYLDPDGLDLDAGTTHLWFRAPDGTMASYVRILTEADGHVIGRVVTDPSYRGHRLAGHLIDVALARCPGAVRLKAQSQLVHVYARHGFLVDGPELVEDEIPHTPMRLA